MLIITGISTEKTNELNTYAMSCRNITIFYRQKLAFLFQLQDKLYAFSDSK